MNPNSSIPAECDPGPVPEVYLEDAQPISGLWEAIANYAAELERRAARSHLFGPVLRASAHRLGQILDDHPQPHMTRQYGVLVNGEIRALHRLGDGADLEGHQLFVREVSEWRETEGRQQ